MIEFDAAQIRSDIIRRAGANPIGESWGTVWFVDPVTKSTLLLTPEEVTPANVKRKLKKSRRAFGIRHCWLQRLANWWRKHRAIV
jgi:hypothetical protein